MTRKHHCSGCNKTKPCGKCKVAKQAKAAVQADSPSSFPNIPQYKGVEDCVSAKIPIIARDHPEMAEDQRVATAFSMCGEDKAYTSTGKGEWTNPGEKAFLLSGGGKLAPGLDVRNQSRCPASAGVGGQDTQRGVGYAGRLHGGGREHGR